jgi:hypothetical protein
VLSAEQLFTLLRLPIDSRHVRVLSRDKWVNAVIVDVHGKARDPKCDVRFTRGALANTCESKVPLSRIKVLQKDQDDPEVFGRIRVTTDGDSSAAVAAAASAISKRTNHATAVEGRGVVVDIASPMDLTSRERNLIGNDVIREIGEALADEVADEASIFTGYRRSDRRFYTGSNGQWSDDPEQAYRNAAREVCERHMAKYGGEVVSMQEALEHATSPASDVANDNSMEVLQNLMKEQLDLKNAIRSLATEEQAAHDSCRKFEEELARAKADVARCQQGYEQALKLMGDKQRLADEKRSRLEGLGDKIKKAALLLAAQQ